MNEKEKVIVTKENDGECVISGGVFYRIIAKGEETNKRFAVMETILEPEQGAPEHIHLNEDEAFYILEGEVEFQINGRTIITKKNDFISCPPGSKRAFSNKTFNNAKILLFYSSSGIEEMTLKDGSLITHYEQMKDKDTRTQCPRLSREFGVIETKTNN